MTGFGTAIWAARLAGVVSVLLLARTAVPFSVVLLASGFPRLWSAIRCWLVPPYLFITVHLMIIIIWKLSEHKQHGDHRPEEEKSAPDAPLPASPTDLVRKPSPEILHGISPFIGDPAESEAKTPVPFPKSGESMPEPSSDASCLTTESDENSTASSHHDIKKGITLTMTSTEAPTEEEDDDTMDATWKAIMKGGAARVVRFSAPEAEPPEAVAAGGGLRRDPSEPGHEEWNRRFDAFIKKNYEQIQESQRGYTRMVNRP